MRNKIKKIFASGKTVNCGWLHIPNTWTAELMANAGWDCLTIDMQHGLHNIETAIQIMPAISTTDTVPIARCNWNTPGEIMRLLDAGAYGIICPMINTKQECESFVGACKYPPQGYRSFGPIRARVYAGKNYIDFANDEILTLAMVETTESVKNIKTIASVNGLDGIFIGSGDLKLSIKSKYPNENTNKIFNEYITIIQNACRENNIVSGIWCPSVKEAKKSKSKGFQFIALKSDSYMLSEYIEQQLQALKKEN